MRGFRKYIKKPVMAFLKKTFSNERIVHISEGDLFMMRKMIFYTVNPNPNPNPSPSPNPNPNREAMKAVSAAAVLSTERR